MTCSSPSLLLLDDELLHTRAHEEEKKIAVSPRRASARVFELFKNAMVPCAPPRENCAPAADRTSQEKVGKKKKEKRSRPALSWGREEERRAQRRKVSVRFFLLQDGVNLCFFYM